MPTIKLTAKTVAGLPTGVFYDAELTGFGVRSGANTRSYFVEYRPGAGGRGIAKKRTKIGSASVLSLDAARAAAKAMLAKVALGADPAQAKAEERASAPFIDVANSYVADHVRVHRKESTAAYYEAVIRSCIASHLGPKRAGAVSETDLSSMHRAVGTDQGRVAANRALAITSAILNWAKLPNRTGDVRRFKEESRERYLSDEETAKLGEALREAETTGLLYEIDETSPKAKHAAKAEKRRTVYGPHVVGALRLYLLTGCRLREILNLEWKHYDAGRGLLFLPDAKSGKRPVVLSAAAVEVLDSLPRIGRFVIASESAGTDDEKPRHDLKKPWAAIRRRAGLEDVRIHDLRHTFASIGAGSDMGLPLIGKLLGHKNAKTTQRYAHVAVGPERRAAEAIGQHVSDLLKGGQR